MSQTAQPFTAWKIPFSCTWRLDNEMWLQNHVNSAKVKFLHYYARPAQLFPIDQVDICKRTALLSFSLYSVLKYNPFLACARNPFSNWERKRILVWNIKDTKPRIFLLFTPTNSCTLETYRIFKFVEVEICPPLSNFPSKWTFNRKEVHAINPNLSSTDVTLTSSGFLYWIYFQNQYFHSYIQL